MADVLSCGSYAFIGGGATSVLGWNPDLPPLLAWALDARKSDPSSRNWPYVVMHDYASRTLNLKIDAATEALARAEVSAIMAACVPGAMLTWQPDGQPSAVSCTVVSSDISLDNIDPTTRCIAKQGVIFVDVTLITTPYWLGPETEYVFDGGGAINGVPNTLTLTDIPGDVPALTRIRYLHDQDTSMLALGLRSNAEAAYSPVADYTGSTVQGSTAATGSLSSANTIYAVGSPSSIDVASNAGDVLVLARVANDVSTASHLSVRALSKVQGTIGAAAQIPGSNALGDAEGWVSAVTANGGYDVLNLGIRSIPAGRVQAGLSGSTWGPESLTNSSTAGATVTALSATQTSYGTITTTNGRFRVEVEGYGDNGNRVVTVWVYSGSMLVASFPLMGFAHAAWSYVSTPSIEAPAGTYTIKLSGTISYGTYGSAHTNAGVANRKVYEQTLVALGATLGVQAKCSDASKHAYLDSVAMLPTNESCVLITGSAGAGEGYVIDYLSDNDADHDVYVADDTDSGISTVATVQPYGGPMLLRPGSNTLVFSAGVPGTGTYGAAHVVVTTRARYLGPFTEG